uniref:PD-(D/E)XK nuclease family protein n=1 Tax=Thermosulfurimonas sp. TaxID=2080236 RepID=UPI0025E9EBD9
LKRESDQRWEEMNRRWEELKRESDQRWEEMLKEVRRVDRRIDRTIGALGARWGLYSEHAFREALAEILSEFGGFQVSRYLAYDETGQVFGHPDQVEIDLLIKDGKVWVAELKSSVSKAEVYAFERKVRFYEEKEGQKVERRLIISPMVDPEARKVAEKLGIQIFAQPEDLEEVQVF